MKVRTYARTSPEENQRERDHRDLARRIAEEGIVLLKNDGALPAAPGNIALYGAGVTKTIFGGSGSGEVDARKYVNVLEGFENAGYTVTTRSWLNDYEAEFEKEQKQFFHEMRTGFLKIRSGADANNILGASFVYPAGRAVTEADVAASKTDTCLYVIARQSGEGSDRKPEEFVFLPEEIAQIRFCAEHYEKTVLVINVGASMDLTGVDEIPGLNAIPTKQLLAYQPMISAVVCEIVLVETESADDVATVEAILQTRIDAQVDGGAWYPESIEGWKNNSRIVSNGNFVMMIAWQFCEDAVADFNALF